MKHRKNKSHTVIQYLITTVFFAKQAKKCLHFPGNLIESMLNCLRTNVCGKETCFLSERTWYRYMISAKVKHAEAKKGSCWISMRLPKKKRRD